jgi:hypothetical protein
MLPPRQEKGGAKISSLQDRRRHSVKLIAERTNLSCQQCGKNRPSRAFVFGSRLHRVATAADACTSRTACTSFVRPRVWNRTGRRPDYHRHDTTKVVSW